MGFEVSIVFVRAGKRIERKKLNNGKTRRQDVSVLEIEKIMEEKFKTKILRKVKKYDSE